MRKAGIQWEYKSSLTRAGLQTVGVFLFWLALGNGVPVRAAPDDLDSMWGALERQHDLTRAAAVEWDCDETMFGTAQQTRCRLHFAQINLLERFRLLQTGLQNVERPEVVFHSLETQNDQKLVYWERFQDGPLESSSTASVRKPSEPVTSFEQQFFGGATRSDTPYRRLYPWRDQMSVSFVMQDGRRGIVCEFVEAAPTGEAIQHRWVLDPEFEYLPRRIERSVTIADPRSGLAVEDVIVRDYSGEVRSGGAILPRSLWVKWSRRTGDGPESNVVDLKIEVTKFDVNPQVDDETFDQRLMPGTRVHDSIEKLEYLIGPSGERTNVKPLVTTVPGSGSTTQDWVDWLLHPAVYGTVGALCLLIYGIARWRFA